MKYDTDAGFELAKEKFPKLTKEALEKEKEACLRKIYELEERVNKIDEELYPPEPYDPNADYGPWGNILMHISPGGYERK